MPSDKLTNNFSTEDLLELLKDTEVSKTSDINNDIINFLNIYDIQPGKSPIGVDLLYKLYSKWGGHQARKTFVREANNYYVLRVSGPKHYYLINKNALKFSTQLLKEFESKELNKTRSKHFKKHFDSYLDFHGIKEGRTWVESYLLYYLYDRWTYKNHNGNPLSYVQFLNFCRLYFKHKRLTSNRVLWFKVNKAVKEFLPEDIIADIRKARRKSEEKEDIKKK